MDSRSSGTCRAGPRFTGALPHHGAAVGAACATLAAGHTLEAGGGEGTPPPVANCPFGIGGNPIDWTNREALIAVIAAKRVDSVEDGKSVSLLDCSSRTRRLAPTATNALFKEDLECHVQTANC